MPKNLKTVTVVGSETLLRPDGRVAIRLDTRELGSTTTHSVSLSTRLPWLTAAVKRLHHNVLATALANKLARIAWTVLAQRRNYGRAS